MFDIVDRTHVLISVGVVAAPVQYPGPFFVGLKFFLGLQ